MNSKSMAKVLRTTMSVTAAVVFSTSCGVVNAVAQEQELSTGEAIAAAQSDGNAALAGRGADVEKSVTERTAATLKISPKRVGQYDAKKGRIAVIGSASKKITDPQQDKKGEWFAFRSMLAKQALLNAKMELAMALGAEMSAEEAAETFDVPVSTNNPSGGTKNTVSSAIEFSAKHPIMGATVLYQEESYAKGEYKIALSLIWSKELQASAVALLMGDENFKEKKPGKQTLEDWVDSQSALSLMIGPRQYLDSDGIRHFIGISARAVGSNPTFKQKNKLIAQNDARATAMFSVLADVEARSASESMMEQYTENSDDLDSMTTDTIAESMSSKISQKIEKQYVTGLTPLFEETIEHPLCPGMDMYVVGFEINAENAREMQKNADKLAKDRVNVAKKNNENLAKKAAQDKAIEDAKNGVYKVDGDPFANSKPAPVMKEGVVAGDAEAEDNF